MRRIALLIVLLFVISCKESNSKLPIVTQELTLTGRLFPNQFIMKFPRVKMVGDKLLVISPRQDPLFHIYSIGDSLERIASYGNRGKASNEFTYPEVTSIIGDTIIVHDMQDKLRTLLFEPQKGEIRELSIQKIESKLNIDGIGHTDIRVNKMESGNYVGLSMIESDKWFSYYDKNLRFPRFFGDIDFFKGATSRSNITGGQGMLSVKGDNIVFCMSALPYITMYKVQDDDIVKKWEDRIFPLDFMIIDGSIKFTSETKGSFKGLALSDKYIFALFSEKNLKEKNSDGAANIVYAYNYNGDRLAKIDLDRDINEICTNKDGTKLYAFEVESGGIVEYDMSDLSFKF